MAAADITSSARRSIGMIQIARGILGRSRSRSDRDLYEHAFIEMTRKGTSGQRKKGQAHEGFL